MFQDLRYCSIPICVSSLENVKTDPGITLAFASQDKTFFPIFTSHSCFYNLHESSRPQDCQDRKASTAVTGQPRLPRQDNQVGKISLNYISDSAVHICDLMPICGTTPW